MYQICTGWPSTDSCFYVRFPMDRDSSHFYDYRFYRIFFFFFFYFYFVFVSFFHFFENTFEFVYLGTHTHNTHRNRYTINIYSTANRTTTNKQHTHCRRRIMFTYENPELCKRCATLKERTKGRACVRTNVSMYACCARACVCVCEREREREGEEKRKKY